MRERCQRDVTACAILGPLTPDPSPPEGRGEKRLLASVLVVVVCLAIASGALAQVKELPPTAPAKPAVKEKKTSIDKEAKEEEGLLASDQLTAADPKSKHSPGGYAKVYTIKMHAGTTYVIDMTSTAFDSYLHLEDSTGRHLMGDDDSGGSLNSRITFACPLTDTYRITATSLGGGQTGPFTLKVMPHGKTPTPSMLKIMGARVEAGDIVITRDFVLTTAGHGSLESSHGYIEARFTVKNLSPTETHRITLTAPKHRGGNPYGYSIRSLRRSVDIGPKATVPVSLFVPEVPLSGHGGVEVEIDGKMLADELSGIDGFRRGDWRSSVYSGGPAGRGSAVNVLAPADLGPFMQFRVAGVPARAPGGRGFSFHSTFDPVATWSKNWLGYSCFDGIVLRGKELDAATPEVQAALWQYVECGGSLLVLGEAKLSESWNSTRNAIGNSNLSVYSPGFGQCLVHGNDIKSWEAGDWARIARMWEESAAPFNLSRSPSNMQASFPVVENMGVPVRGLFILMLVFAILIGPVNLYLLSRKKRRIWLLWTVPCFSLITCLAVFGFMVVSEGWTGHVRTEGLTILDETSKRASSIGWQGFYCPMTPGDGLHYGYETELIPQLGSDHRRYRPEAGSSRSMDWTDDQHLESGWITARVPAFFQIRSGEKRRERIVARMSGETASMVNGLGAAIQTIWLADKQGNIYTASDIPPGGEMALKREDNRQAVGKAEVLRTWFALDWLTLIDGMTRNPDQYLRPGTYLAVFDETPFFEKGLRHAQSRKGRSIVFGVMQEPLEK